MEDAEEELYIQDPNLLRNDTVVDATADAGFLDDSQKKVVIPIVDVEIEEMKAKPEYINESGTITYNDVQNMMTVEDNSRVKLFVDALVDGMLNVHETEITSSRYFECLRPYQLDAVVWMLYRDGKYRQYVADFTEPLGGLVCSSVGFGKTITTVAMMFANRDMWRKTLIVCSSTIIANWSQEVDRFNALTPNNERANVTIIRTRLDMRKICNNPTSAMEIFIVTPKLLSIMLNDHHRKKVPDRLYFVDRIIYDEAHGLTGNCVRYFTQTRVRAKVRWALTATPIPNALQDLFRIIRWLRLPIHWDLNQLKSIFMICHDVQYRVKMQLIHERVKFKTNAERQFFKRKREDFDNKAPHMYEFQWAFHAFCAKDAYPKESDEGEDEDYEERNPSKKHPVSLIMQAAIMYQGMLSMIKRPDKKGAEACIAEPTMNDAVNEVRRGCEGAAEINAQAERLRPEARASRWEADVKITDDMDSDTKISRITNPKYESVKMEHILNVMYDVLKRREKIVVFYTFNSELTVLKTHLDGHNISYRVLNGSTPMAVRNDVLKEMRSNDETCVLLLHKDVGAAGLNLQFACNIVISRPPWTFSGLEQMIGRCYRQLQRKPVAVLTLTLKETGEEKLWEKIDAKAMLMKAFKTVGNESRFITYNARDKKYGVEPREHEEIVFKTLEMRDKTASDVLKTPIHTCSWGLLPQKTRTQFVFPATFSLTYLERKLRRSC